MAKVVPNEDGMRKKSEGIKKIVITCSKMDESEGTVEALPCVSFKVEKSARLLKFAGETVSRGRPCFQVDVRLPGKGTPNPHGARPVHLIITMIKWVHTSGLSIKNSLALQGKTAKDVAAGTKCVLAKKPAQPEHEGIGEGGVGGLQSLRIGREVGRRTGGAGRMGGNLQVCSPSASPG